MVRRPLFVARRQASPLLEPIDQSFDLVALAVDPSVERPRAPLIRLSRDRDPNAMPPQVCPDLATTLPFVTDDALWPQPGTPPTRSFDCALLHHLLKGGRLVAFPWCQDEGDWLSHALNAHMDLGAEAPLAPAECLGFWVPLFAPAACWWARMTVAST